MVRDRAPDVRIERLFDDRFVGVVRPGHPLSQGAVTADRFAAADHLVVSRRGRLAGPVDTALADRGLARRVVAACPTFTSSLFVLHGSDLVGILGERMHRELAERQGLAVFEIPLDLPPLEISMAWHACYDADGAHSWLREQVREVFARR